MGSDVMLFVFIKSGLTLLLCFIQIANGAYTASLISDINLSERFLSACELNCDKSIRECFALGANISLFHNSEIPLLWAVKNDKLCLTEELLKMGQDVNVKNSNEDTALHLASELGKYEFVMILLKYGADADSRNIGLYSPLHLASMNGHLEICKLLVWYGSDINAFDEADWTPLHLACNSCKCTELSKFFLENCADFTLRDIDGWTALHYAVHSKNVVAVNDLLQVGADPYVLDEMEQSPFSMACVKGHLDIIKLMLNYLKTLDVNEALLSACHSNNVKLVDLFLNMGANINFRNEDNWTPLHFAYSCMTTSEDVINHLLSHGANVLARDLENKVPSDYKR